MACNRTFIVIIRFQSEEGQHSIESENLKPDPTLGVRGGCMAHEERKPLARARNFHNTHVLHRRNKCKTPSLSPQNNVRRYARSSISSSQPRLAYTFTCCSSCWSDFGVSVSAASAADGLADNDLIGVTSTTWSPM